MGRKCLALGLSLLLIYSGSKAETRDVGTAALESRIAAPDQAIIAKFESVGMKDVSPHTLTRAELARVEDVLSALPALHRAVLAASLHHLSFVDGIPGEGTGLTSRAEDGKFDITLRASLLDESLSTFLTTKERRLFVPDGSGQTISVDATGADALTYVLLHEATHVVDGARRLSTDADSTLVKGIWESRTGLAADLAASPAASTPFRGSAPVPMSQAATVYDALSRSPFVSLYATAAAPEDLAELVAWHEVAQAHGGSLTITIRDAAGVPLKRYQPLDFPAIKARMKLVDDLLASGAGNS